MVLSIPEHFDVFGQHINENIRRNGERVWIDWRNRLILNNQGEGIEILSVGADITELKQAEQKINQLHKDLQQHAQNLENRWKTAPPS